MADSHGDEVLSDLVRQRGRQLTGYAYLLTGDVASAQDLVQDALVKVFVRTRAGFTPEIAEAYVRRSIVRVYVDGFRRRRKWASVRHLVAQTEAGDGPEPTTADRIDLRAALATLPPQERACVVLRYYEDLPIADVADQMHLAPGTVKRYLSNAVHKLQTRLGPIDLPEVDETVAVAPLRHAGTPGSPSRASDTSSGSRS
jgi:RNA polymerase sigma-70 factor (sigma-E family)